VTERIMKLKGRVVEKGLTQEYVAQKAGITRSTFQRKLKTGGDDITVGQLRIIATLLHFSSDEVNAFVMSIQSH